MRNSEDIILAPPPQRQKKRPARVKIPPGLSPYLASLYSIPLLDRDEEVYYFRKMNFLKFRAARLREQLDNSLTKSRDLNKIEKWLDMSLQVKNFLIRSNLRLVVSIAKRHIKPHTNFFELVSDGNLPLMRAVDRFDYTKGNKFSTYASWAIMRNFARSIPIDYAWFDRFRTGKDEIFQQSPDTRANPLYEELVNHKQHQLIMGMLEHLDDSERDIITIRYGLHRGSEPQTLQQVGNRFGVTKERIRQLEVRAMRKLREIAGDKKLEIPEF